MMDVSDIIQSNEEDDEEFLKGKAENITIDAALMLRGDANWSGSLDTADSLLMLRIALGIIPANETERIICDMDGDGAITSIDALLVFRKAMGIE